MRDVVAVRAEGDQIFQLCFLRLLAFAQGVKVVGLDDFPVVVEAAGDTGEAVAFLGLVREIPHAGVGDAIVSREIQLPPRNQFPIRKPAQRVGSLLRAGNVARGHRIEVFQIDEQTPRVGARILELLICLLIEGRIGCIEGFHEPLPDLLEAARKIKRLLANRDVAPAVDDDALQELFKGAVGVVGLPVHGREFDRVSVGIQCLDELANAGDGVAVKHAVIALQMDPCAELRIAGLQIGLHRPISSF
jgi:hypothetical protein